MVWAYLAFMPRRSTALVSFGFDGASLLGRIDATSVPPSVEALQRMAAGAIDFGDEFVGEPAFSVRLLEIVEIPRSESLR